MARVLSGELTFIVLDIINRLDFIDYGVLVSHTQVYFDRENFEIVVVSPYYFKYVSRGGQSLVSDFLTDPRFSAFLSAAYKTYTNTFFDRMLSGLGVKNLIAPTPTLVIVDTMDYDELKSIRQGLTPRHS